LKNAIIKVKGKIFDHKILIQNFSYLSALQAFSILIPLITYPYLIRVLGNETYGLVVFAQAIMQYFIIVINFGFNISATQSISIHRDNNKMLSEIVSSILILKAILFVITSLILVLLIGIVPILRNNYLLFIFSMFLCIQETIFPTWYFQGIEKMGYITRITIIAKTISTILIFFIITKESDYYYLPILSGVGSFIAGIYALYLIFIKSRIKFIIPKYSALKEHLLASTNYFISNLSILGYSSANRIILGSFSSMVDVSYYDLAEKILGLLKSFVSTIEQVIFPKLSKSKDKYFLKRIRNITLLSSGILIFIIFIFSNNLLSILGGRQMLEAINPLRILSLNIFPIILSLFWGHLTLIVWGHNNDFLKLRLISLMSYFLLISIHSLLLEFNATSLAFLALMNESLIAIYSFYFAKKNKLI
jgi:PST family polysaccharide transporter